MPSVTQLLVSVRSAGEADAALLGGADLIDVKEPARGALGRADDATVAAVVRAVAGRRPVSAALGELRDFLPPHPPGLAFVKWGLSGLGHDWRGKLSQAAEHLGTTAPVAVAYADHVQASAPSPREVAEFAASRHWPAFLLDTFEKDGRTLLDWLGIDELHDLCRLCHDAGVRVALAGSLRLEHVEMLTILQPDWLAVRSAACVDGRRDQAVCPKRVAELKHALVVGV
jgi:uncharacterized protein (UPF0264 family)